MENTYFDTFGDAASDFDGIEPDPYADWVDAQYDDWASQYDDDPNPYHGDYSEM